MAIRPLLPGNTVNRVLIVLSINSTQCLVVSILYSQYTLLTVLRELSTCTDDCQYRYEYKTSNIEKGVPRMVKCTYY